VDDSPQFLAAARDFLACQPGIEIAGCSLSGAEAIELIPMLRPDVVLLDLFMPEMNGLEATRRIKALPEPPRIVVVTLNDDPTFRSAAFDHGSDGFVSKAALPTQLMRLIRDWYA
jgi:DNA-binding NarL/FixJ family response regulator